MVYFCARPANDRLAHRLFSNGNANPNIRPAETDYPIVTIEL